MIALVDTDPLIGKWSSQVVCGAAPLLKELHHPSDFARQASIWPASSSFDPILLGARLYFILLVNNGKSWLKSDTAPITWNPRIIHCMHIAEEFQKYILSSEFSSTSSTYKDHFLCLAESQIIWGRKVLSPCILNIIAIFPSQSESSMKSCAALMHNIMYQVVQLLSIKLAMCNLKWSNMQ